MIWRAVMGVRQKERALEAPFYFAVFLIQHRNSPSSFAEQKEEAKDAATNEQSFASDHANQGDASWNRLG